MALLTKEVGLRKFYANDNYAKLKPEGFMDNIMLLANFWRYINTGIKPEEEEYIISVDAQKYLRCLMCYPNEFCKYVTRYFLSEIRIQKALKTTLVNS